MMTMKLTMMMRQTTLSLTTLLPLPLGPAKAETLGTGRSKIAAKKKQSAQQAKVMKRLSLAGELGNIGAIEEEESMYAIGDETGARQAKAALGKSIGAGGVGAARRDSDAMYALGDELGAAVGATVKKERGSSMYALGDELGVTRPTISKQLPTASDGASGNRTKKDLAQSILQLGAATSEIDDDGELYEMAEHSEDEAVDAGAGGGGASTTSTMRLPQPG